MVPNALLRQHLVALYVDKAPATVIGWIWKAVLVLSLKVMFIPHFYARGGDQESIREARTAAALDGDSTPSRDRFLFPLMHFATYTFILLVSLRISEKAEQAAAVASKAGRPKHAFRLKVVVLGMALLPAWAFKDVVAAVMTAASGHLGGFLPALLILIFASVASIVLPSQSDVKAGGNICIEIGARASGSMGLGVAFACNDVVKYFAGDRWGFVPFQLVYSPLSTLVMSVARPRLVEFSAETSEQNFILKRAVSFLATTSSFFVAWAWNAFILRIFALLLPPCSVGDCLWMTFARDLVVALIVTGAAAGMVFLLAAVQPDKQASRAAVELATLAAGINVGSFWTDAASSIYAVAGRGLWHCWALCFVLTICVPLLALMSLALIDRIQPPEPMLFEALLDNEGISTIGNDVGDSGGDAGGSS